MIKNCKGITLISLSIAVIIVLTITGMILYSAKDSVYIEKLTNMQNDIKNLRDKVSSYYSEYGEIPVKTEFTDISNMENAQIIGANDTGKFYILELEKLNGLTLNYGEDYEIYKTNGYLYTSDLTDIYIINENSHNIFYVEGIRITENGVNKIYYTDYLDADQEKVELREIQKWQEIENEDGDIVVTNGIAEFKIGDYIDYNPQTGASKTIYTSTKDRTGYTEDQVFNLSSYTYGWRVLGVNEDNSEILLISEDYIGPDSGGYEQYGRTYYYLVGEKGYANGVQELNNICELYGQGKGANIARSITIEDVNSLTKYEPEIAKWGNSNIQEYGSNVTYTSEGLSFFNPGKNSWTNLESGRSIILMNNYYNYSDSNELLFYNSTNSKIDDSYSGTMTGCYYWLASPYLVTYDRSSIFWGLHAIDKTATGNSVNAEDANDCSMVLTDSDINERTKYRGIRPIVSLKADIAILQQQGTAENPHQIQ